MNSILTAAWDQTTWFRFIHFPGPERSGPLGEAVNYRKCRFFTCSDAHTVLRLHVFQLTDQRRCFLCVFQPTRAHRRLEPRSCPHVSGAQPEKKKSRRWCSTFLAATRSGAHIFLERDVEEAARARACRGNQLKKILKLIGREFYIN